MFNKSQEPGIFALSIPTHQHSSQRCSGVTMIMELHKMWAERVPTTYQRGALHAPVT